LKTKKTARRFIKKISSGKSQASLNIHILNKYTEANELPTFLEACKSGKSVGLLSEAGCPGIADPGADIVKIAHQQNIRVIPLVGPSSILLALMSSGMNGQHFAFNGYLPIDKSERKTKLKQLERISGEQHQTQIFIETPYRNNKMLEDICASLQAHTNVCIACDITLPTEYIKTKTVEAWKRTTIDLHKRPAIFIIQKD
jgi:16S rRNA (cytidine1402-2'-O)-methyltransferase